VQVVGAGLLVLTLSSIARHRVERKAAQARGVEDTQSVSERLLNNLLLYAWLAFMLAFSTGMIVNN
jgi:hypothetical protein